ncbi:MAG: hypothetical protein IJW22_00140 [Clostridia bacterium]|nr:hypothetical protein [Clostridia bacterium]
MCNIAGYVGERDAAPILIKMIKQQEGFNGGYYTGIATLHEGKLYYEKLTGDTDYLTSHTRAASLPGKIGIIHSRTRSGGGDEWAHPFVGMHGDAPFCAYVANGGVGCYKGCAQEYNEMAQALLDEGYPLASQIQIDPPAYTQLRDGSSVHMSDVMCQMILRQMEKEPDPATAMANAFCEMPSEIVGLLLSLDAPDRIIYSRFNMPMSVAFAAHGAYLASSPLAFPADAREHALLMANSSGYVFRDRFTTLPMQAPPMPVAAITADLRARAYHAAIKTLKEKEMTYAEVSRLVISPLFEEEAPRPVAALTYDTLLALKKRGLLKERLEMREGVFPHLTAPKVMLSI